MCLTPESGMNYNKTDEVLKAGVELTNNSEVKKDVHNFMIGATMYAIKDDLRSGKMEERKAGNELIKYFIDFRDGRIPRPLSYEAKQMERVISSMFRRGDIGEELISQFINDGKSVTEFNYDTSGL